MKLNEYWHHVETLKKSNPYMRNGQAAYNVLSNLNPNLAEKVINYKIDPFYVHNVNDETYRWCE